VRGGGEEELKILVTELMEERAARERERERAGRNY